MIKRSDIKKEPQIGKCNNQIKFCENLQYQC